MKEFENCLRTINAALALLKNNDETEIKLTVCLPNNNVLEYWISENENAVNLLESEKDAVESDMSQNVKIADIEDYRIKRLAQLKAELEGSIQRILYLQRKKKLTSTEFLELAVINWRHGYHSRFV